MALLALELLAVVALLSLRSARRLYFGAGWRFRVLKRRDPTVPSLTSLTRGMPVAGTLGCRPAGRTANIPQSD